MSWKDDAINLYYMGYNHIQICDKLCFDIGAPNRDAALHRIKRLLANEGLKQESSSLNVVSENFIPVESKEKWSGTKKIKFALMGDTQINSKYTQLTYLHDFYDRCKLNGVHTVYHTGDIDEGEQMRIGHQYECYTQGADEHVNEIIRVYPKIEGITTKFITGNHDASMYKRCGLDIGRAISDKRSDMIYLGRDCAIINLTPNCTLELRHPWDGTTYALSYKTQKIIDSMPDNSKPDILAIGHYHKMEQLFYSGVHAFQTATFQAQTPFMRGKGISCSIGGWICEVEVNESGCIIDITTKFIPYSIPIENDYKNFR